MTDNPTKKEVGKKSKFVSSHLYKPNTISLTRLAQATSLVIATLLAIPDAIAIIPTVTNPASWVLRLIGVWLIAAVLWFVGFLFILQCVRFIVRGVEIGETGIKLWRYGRPMLWAEVDAISIEPQYFFTRLFGLSQTAKRLTIFEKKRARGGKTKLVPNYLPSFFFLPEDFEKLCRQALSARFGLSPASIDAFVTEPQSWAQLRSMFGTMHWQRVVWTGLIILGLCCWFYRKAISIYAYNSGNQAMARFAYDEAKKDYEWSVQTEPTYAPGWNMLGHANFHLNDFSQAKTDWERAIQFKPDFVEPRISLSYLALANRQYKKAKELIDQALTLDPLDPYALINRADLEMTFGRTRHAMSDARIVLTEDRDKIGALRTTAACLLARGKVRLGEPEEARKVLDLLGPGSKENPRNTNIALRWTVEGEINLALGKPQTAEKDFKAAIAANRYTAEAMNGLATVYMDMHRLEDAQKQIAKLAEQFPDDSKLRLLRARMRFLQGDKPGSTNLVSQVLATPELDGPSLVEAGNLLLTLSDYNRAALCAQKAISLDAADQSARRLLILASAHFPGALQSR